MGGKYWKELLDGNSVRVSLSLTTLLFMHSDLFASSSKSLHAPVPGQFLGSILILLQDYYGKKGLGTLARF
jgi:hypothetical protein